MSAQVLPLVFTDLDGSLLDHHSYSFDGARPVLARLDTADVPVIIATSKTRAEVLRIREAMGNSHPFIAENGAAIYIPSGYFSEIPAECVEREGYWVKAFSPGRDRWLDALRELEHQYPAEFDYFFRAAEVGIANMTGLSAAEAALANQREFSEPVQWRGSEQRKREFVAALRKRGACAQQGGRFLTLSGDCDKGRALRWLRELYAQQNKGVEICDIAVGDSGNDVAMLEAAQAALVVRSPVHAYPELQRSEGVIYSAGFGPEGWAEGVGQWLRASIGNGTG